MKKTIFITGAASGIGRATALLFGRRGFSVAATTSTSTAQRRSPSRCRARATDASMSRTKNREDVSSADCRKQLDVNVTGVVLGVQRSLLLLERTGDAAIVNMSSASAVYGQPELAVYSARRNTARPRSSDVASC